MTDNIELPPRPERGAEILDVPMWDANQLDAYGLACYEVGILAAMASTPVGEVPISIPRGVFLGERHFPVEVFSPGHYSITMKDGKIGFQKMIEKENVNAQS